MSRILDIEASAASRGSALLHNAGAAAQALSDAVVRLASFLRKCAVTWHKRRRSRLELLNYMAQDHRALGDMGASRSDADFWVQKPFWRA